MKDNQKLAIEEILVNHIVKTAYIGFMLSKDANEYLRQTVTVDKDWLLRLLEKYNNETKNEFYKVRVWGTDKEEISLYVLGVQRYGHNIFVTKILDNLNQLLQENIKAAVTQGKEPVVFDINTLQPLKVRSYTTMGRKYEASDSKRYTLHFFHIYDITHGYY